jgi:hypothetical protein
MDPSTNTPLAGSEAWCRMHDNEFNRINKIMADSRRGAGDRLAALLASDSVSDEPVALICRCGASAGATAAGATAAGTSTSSP